jgi:hypothetical protein
MWVDMSTRSRDGNGFVILLVCFAGDVNHTFTSFETTLSAI